MSLAYAKHVEEMKKAGKPPKKPGEFGIIDTSKDPVLTTQADRDEVDINKIVARIYKTGQMPPMLGGEPFYGDVSEISDLQDCYIKIQEAEDMFMSQPAEIRERFEHSPVKFVEFFEDPGNLEEAIKLGLAQKRPEPVVTPPVPPVGAPAQ